MNIFSLTGLLTLLFLLICALLILVVLVQRGRGGGLSGAFGMGGGSGTAFGTKTGDVFTTVTVVLFAVFLLSAIGLNYRFQHDEKIRQHPELLNAGGQSNNASGTQPAEDPFKSLGLPGPTAPSTTPATLQPAASLPALPVPPASTPATTPAK